MKTLTFSILFFFASTQAFSQGTVTGERFRLNIGPVTIHSGSGAPSGAFGAVRDIYVRTDTTPYTIFKKTGASTWQAIAEIPSSSGAGDLLYASSSSGTGSIADVGAGSVLISNSGLPGWSSTPPVTSLTASDFVGSSTYTSRTTGWRATDVGAADFRYLFTDELHASRFIADLEQALAGSQIITKSVAVLQSAFVCPSAGGTTTLSIEDLPGADNMQVFDVNDWVVIRAFSRASQTLTAVDCVGQVSSPDTSPAGYQTWTFTRGSGGNAGAMGAGNGASRGGLVLDYGTSGNGYHEVSAVDGTDAVNSPYSQTVTWTTSPVAANRAIRTRVGNLRGITSVAEWGAIFGTYATTGDRSYLRMSDQAFELHGVDLRLWDWSATTGGPVIRLERNSGSPYFALGIPAPTTYGGTTGIWMGEDSGVYKARVGNMSGNRWAWDGTNLTLVSATVQIDSAGIAITPSTSVESSRSYKFTVDNGELGLFGTEDAPSTFGRSAILRSSWTGTGNYTEGNWVKVEALHTPSSGGTTRQAWFRAHADSSNGDVEIRADSGTVLIQSFYVTTDAIFRGLTVPLQTESVNLGTSTLHIRDSGNNAVTSDPGMPWIQGNGATIAISARSTANGGAIYIGEYTNAGIYIGRGQGTVTCGLYVTNNLIGCDPSDARLKENIRRYNSGLSVIRAMNPVSYQLKADETRRVHAGFVAQDVRKILPEAVLSTSVGSTDGNEYLTLDQGPIIAALVNAVKELSREVDSLKRRK